MKTLVFRCAAAVLLLTAQLAAGATPNAVVEAVQMPAWVERGKVNIPLAPGMELRNKDRLHTGASSKLLLKMGEGSLVRLGEDANLVLDQMGMNKDRVFVAVMNVLKGAFRFTTAALQAHRRRNIKVAVDTVAVGIRGTDVWSKAAAPKDIVCLIEGRIEVQRGSEQPFRMDQAMSFYVAPKGKPALPVAPVTAKQLKIWLAETDIAPGAGAARRGGKWSVITASVATRAQANNLAGALRVAGYAARIRLQTREKKPVYQVYLGQLASKADAEALAASIRGKMGVTHPGVSM